MADIHIERDHGLGLEKAREIAAHWKADAESKFDMQCDYVQCEPGASQTDVLEFSRMGVSGTMTVDASKFVLDAKLGFLFSSFQDQIEAKIESQLDEMISKYA